ncbi:MAG: PH domain-containing protein [Gemmatimonadota bacterium]
MHQAATEALGERGVDPRTVTRPDGALHTYYLIVSLFGFVFFPFIYLPLLFKYQTLRYRFDEDGVSMSWGRFWHRETYLTYRRIQDIQMARGLIQRWLGLASLKLQTASGGGGAEMTIEGIRHPERLRDFLYDRMRGASDDSQEGSTEGPAGLSPRTGASEVSQGGAPDEVLALLIEIRDELRRVRGPRHGGAEG